MEIQQATLPYLEVIVPMFDDFRMCYEQPSDRNAARTYLKDRIEKNESLILVAIDSGKNGEEATGFVQLYPSFSTVSLKKFWQLSDLYVVPEFRKQGVAKELIDAAKKIAKDYSSEGLIIETRITNQSALRLYDSVGFKRVGEHLYYILEE